MERLQQNRGPAMLRNVIWDVDGTLFDTYPALARAFQAALNDLGRNASLEWIEKLARKSLGHCVSTLAEQSRLTAEDIAERFESHYSRTKPEAQPPFPGVTTICAYVCSIGGKNVIVTHRGKASTGELLAANAMTAYFAGCLTREDGYPKKPDPAAFKAVLNRHDMKREETIAVGDRDIDILAGQAAGVSTCLVGVEIEGISPDLTISSFDELYQHILAQKR
jgi:phosphoglycolate phosphatase-like HAD superfamily hydrolase